MTQLLNMVLKIMKYGSDCCHFVSGSLYEVYHSMTSWTRMTWASAGSNKYCHALIFISSLLVRSEAAWVHPEELNFKAIYYIYISSQKYFAAKILIQYPCKVCKWKYLHIFYIFWAASVFGSLVGVPCLHIFLHKCCGVIAFFSR